MTETVKIWIEDFNNGDITVEEEIEEVKVAISNERIWAKGSSSDDEMLMHLGNIDELEEYLEWLENVAR